MSRALPPVMKLCIMQPKEAAAGAEVRRAAPPTSRTGMLLSYERLPVFCTYVLPVAIWVPFLVLMYCKPKVKDKKYLGRFFKTWIGGGKPARVP